MLEQLRVRTQIKLSLSNRCTNNIYRRGKCGIDEAGSNSGLDICVHFHSNGHEKGINQVCIR